MNEEEIIERFCNLSAKVGDFFDSQFAYDCFCGMGSIPGPYQFDEIIVNFIEMCATERMNSIENMPDEIDVQIAKLLLIKKLREKS